MLEIPMAAALMSLWLAPSTGTAAITFRVQGRMIEATLRAPRAAFDNLPAQAPAALVAGSCAVRADDIGLQPELQRPKVRVVYSDADSIVTAVVRYHTGASPHTLDVSCALFPARVAVLPRPTLVVVLAGNRGKTAMITANADGRVDAGIRLGW